MVESVQAVMLRCVERTTEHRFESRVNNSASCIQFYLIIYSTMARSGHKLSECQIFIVKGRQGCLM